MAINFRCGEAVWAYKTTYDERYARFGPGALLEVEGTLAMLADPTIAWVDSCSEGDNELLRELWHGHRKVGDLAIAVRPDAKLALYSVIAAARAKWRAREILKAAYWRIRGSRGHRAIWTSAAGGRRS
jgi:hypothetical protein